nr:hypothetical protein [candidate division Zixibacteria bacterium]
MLRLFRLAIPALILVSMIGTASFSEPLWIFDNAAPFLDIRANITSSNSKYEYYRVEESTNDFDGINEIRTSYRRINMASMGLTLEKSYLFSSVTLSTPFADEELGFDPCLDINGGVRYGDFQVYAGIFSDLNRDCLNQISSPLYGGIGALHRLDKLGIGYDFRYLHGRYDEDWLNHDYEIYSLSARLACLIDIFHPYLYFSYDKWTFPDDHSFNFGIGFTLGGLPYTLGAESRRISNEITVTPDGVVRKPNIYLYPEKESEVSVRINPNGYITASLPDYSDGWRVTAYPDGSIPGTEGFLFYEAEVSYDKPEEGWCLASGDLPAFYDSLLINCGFNEKEISDFVEYWTVNLPAADYFAVYPLFNEAVDHICPLEVTPGPDNILRLWLIFEPVSKMVQLEKPEIPPFERTNFTVTEWGGMVAGE